MQIKLQIDVHGFDDAEDFLNFVDLITYLGACVCLIVKGVQSSDYVWTDDSDMTIEE